MKKVLLYSDYFLCGTGFGEVTKHIVNTLKGKYELHQLAINFLGEFHDNKEWPVQVLSAKLKDSKDPMGGKMFLDILSKGTYDIVWVMNDTFAIENLAKALPELKEKMKVTGRKFPHIVYYYPIDCNLLPEFTTMLQLADTVVAYSEFAISETRKTLPKLTNINKVIYLGVDTNTFKPLDNRLQLREEIFKINSNVFLWGNFNRNSQRKDIAKTILAFKQFKDRYQKPTKLYLHTASIDGTPGNIINLMTAVRDAGLTDQDVIFPKGYNSTSPFPREVVNYLYNCLDGFITTTLGEGFGLTALEAGAAGVPCIVGPDNTIFKELTKDFIHLYPCKEKVYVDNSGYRPIGQLEDIVETMLRAVKEPNKSFKDHVQKFNWNNIGSEWLQLFKEIESQKVVKSSIQQKGRML